LLLAIAGCLVGPDYVQPKAPTNASWSEQTDSRFVVNAAVNTAWWNGFADPTLDQLVEIAYRQNLPLQITGLRILEARAELGVAVGNQWPSGGPTAQANAVGISSHAANSSFVNKRFGAYQVGFDATWELDFWGKYRRGVRAANAAYLATVADYDNALVALTAEVARTYVAIRTDEVLIDEAHENEQVQAEALDIAQARFKNGATSELDVMQAQTLLATTRSGIPELQLNLRQAQNALSTLLGQTPGTVQTILATRHGIPAAPAHVQISVPAEMLRRRPDIRAAEFRAIAQCDQIGVAKADLYPKFVLSGSVSTQTSNFGGKLSNNSTLGNLFGPGSLAYNLGGSLLWPLLDYKRILNNVRVQDAKFQEALVDYVNTVITAQQEVEDGMTGYLREQDAAAFAQEAVTASQQAVKIALVQYREGSVDYTRVLDTQRSLLDSMNKLTNTQSAAVTNLIALYKALGGGWELRMANPVVNDVIVDEMRRRTNWGGYFQHQTPGRK
jgi:NodT family efflux transporter outer membrane factor (OMF) lipoprotein